MNTNGRLWPIILLALLAPLSALAAPQSDAPLRVVKVGFYSHATKLAGSVVLPPNGQIKAAVVFIHGSGEQTRNLDVAEKFARQDIAALVYDKRGVGASGGKYQGKRNVSEKNLSLLADDAVAALGELARLPSLKGVPVGLAGISQAGWIAPLAAQRSPQVKFLVLWSGPVCKVSEEDIYSKFTADADAKTVPSYEQALNSRAEKYIWPESMGRDTDPVEDLDMLAIPGLWIFSDNDASIPVDLSIARMEALQKNGHAFEYQLVSGLGHNNMDQTFATATDWIRNLPKKYLRSAAR